MGTQDPPVTKVGMQAFSSLCSTRHPSNIMTGLFVRLLQEHFATAAAIEYNGVNEPATDLSNYLWSADATKTKIQIEPIWRYNPRDVQRRPAIFVKRNSWKFERIALDDGMTIGSRKDAAGKVVNVDGDYHVKMILGSHTIFCLGQSGDGAGSELLGQEVLNHFMMFGPILRQDLKLTRFTVTELGELALLDEFVEHFAVPVVVSYGMTMAWRLNQAAPWLKTLAIDLTARSTG